MRCKQPLARLGCGAHTHRRLRVNSLQFPTALGFIQSHFFDIFCSKLAVALRITADLPDDSVIDTWFAEPVRLLLIPADIFLTNRNSFPVLSRRHQSVVRKFFQLPGMRVLLTGRPHHRLNWEP